MAKHKIFDSNEVLVDAVSLNDSVNDPENQPVLVQDGMERLRTNVIDFFESHIERISRKEKLVTAIEASLKEDLDSDTLDFGQKLALLRELSKESFSSSDSLLAIFKPTPGTPSILADAVGRKVESIDDLEDIFTGMSKEEVDNMKTLMNMMSQMKEQES